MLAILRFSTQNFPSSITLENETIPLNVTVNSRAKRMILRIDRQKRVVRITLPRSTWVNRIKEFVDTHRTWIQAHLPPPLAGVYSGMEFPILGQNTCLHLGPARPRIHLEGALLRCASPTPETAVPRFLRSLLQNHLEENAPPLAAAMGRKIRSIRLRETRSRWGSCTSIGDLMFNWRLVFAPEEVVTYVMTHEVAHLVHANHSADFWALVAQHRPSYQSERRWLKTRGSELYRYFGGH